MGKVRNESVGRQGPSGRTEAIEKAQRTEKEAEEQCRRLRHRAEDIVRDLNQRATALETRAQSAAEKEAAAMLAELGSMKRRRRHGGERSIGSTQSRGNITKGEGEAEEKQVTMKSYTQAEVTQMVAQAYIDRHNSYLKA